MAASQRDALHCMEHSPQQDIFPQACGVHLVPTNSQTLMAVYYHTSIPKRHKAGPNATSDTGGRPGYGGPGCDEGDCWSYSSGGYFYRTKQSMNWYVWGRWLLLALCLVVIIAAAANWYRVGQKAKKRRMEPPQYPELPSQNQTDYLHPGNQGIPMNEYQQGYQAGYQQAFQQGMQQAPPVYPEANKVV